MHRQDDDLDFRTGFLQVAAGVQSIQERERNINEGKVGVKLFNRFDEGAPSVGVATTFVLYSFSKILRTPSATSRWSSATITCGCMVLDFFAQGNV